MSPEKRPELDKDRIDEIPLQYLHGPAVHIDIAERAQLNR